MIAAGQTLNLDFGVSALIDGEKCEVRFGDLVAGPTIISVYMRNNTPGCDRQTQGLVAVADELISRGYGIIAISRDTCGSHRKYAAKHGIAYTLVSDPEDKFSHAADAMVEKSMYGRKFVGPARAAYVIAADGSVQTVLPRVDTKAHGAQLLAACSPLG